jgi:polar amino acid transport system substrate-binding protein
MSLYRLAETLAVGAMLALSAVVPAAAQTCGTDYAIQEGDSLARIAARVYGKSSSWTVIFYANQDKLGAGTSLLVPGLSLRIPCIGAEKQAEQLPAAATATATAASTTEKPATILQSPTVRRIELLTADDYAPFTGRSLAGGGMFTEIVDKAMQLVKAESNGQFDYAISWVNDWAAHLNPLLATRAFDMGFPWYKPACQDFEILDKDARFRCQKFFFSDPVVEQISVLFVMNESPIRYESDAEIVGRTLCRPSGNWTFDLDQDGRNWVKDKKVTLVMPPSNADCFKMLEAGEVDAVALNEFTGREALIRLDMVKKVKMLEKPLAILTLHVLVAKTHPQARTLLLYMNSALAKLKESGEFDRISERHLQAFWDALAEQERAPADPAVEAAPAPAADAAATATANAAAPAPAGESQ